MDHINFLSNPTNGFTTHIEQNLNSLPCPLAGLGHAYLSFPSPTTPSPPGCSRDVVEYVQLVPPSDSCSCCFLCPDCSASSLHISCSFLSLKLHLRASWLLYPEYATPRHYHCTLFWLLPSLRATCNCLVHALSFWVAVSSSWAKMGVPWTLSCSLLYLSHLDQGREGVSA